MGLEGASNELNNYCIAKVDSIDVDSVLQNDQELTNQSVLLLSHNLVLKTRDTGKKVEFVHVDFVRSWLESRGEPEQININDYIFFFDIQNILLVIPVLINAHYFLIFVENIDLNPSILVVDSMFRDLLAVDMIREMLLPLNTNARTALVHTLDDSMLYGQKDAVSCGVHLLFNLEGYLTHGFDFFTEKHEVDVKKYRNIYAKMLIGIKEAGERNSKNKNDDVHSDDGW